MTAVVVVIHDPDRRASVRTQMGDVEVRAADDLAQLTDAMLWDDTVAVVLDVEHPRVDPLEAVRLVRGTRWDVTLVCIGGGQGAERARRGGAQVHGPDAWTDLAALVTPA